MGDQEDSEQYDKQGSICRQDDEEPLPLVIEAGHQDWSELRTNDITHVNAGAESTDSESAMLGWKPVSNDWDERWEADTLQESQDGEPNEELNVGVLTSKKACHCD